MAHYLFPLLARIVRVWQSLKVIPGERKLTPDTIWPSLRPPSLAGTQLYQLHSISFTPKIDCSLPQRQRTRGPKHPEPAHKRPQPVTCGHSSKPRHPSSRSLSNLRKKNRLLILIAH